MTHAVPSAESPPAVTSRWTCGWYRKARVHVCRTARQPSRAPYIPRIACEREQGRGGALHEQPVHSLLMGSGERPQLIRQGEGEQVVGAGQQAGALRREPAVGLVAVTLRTMTIAAGVKRVHLPPAVIALMDVASQGRRPAGFEIAQGPAVAGQDAIGEARADTPPRGGGRSPPPPA